MWIFIVPRGTKLKIHWSCLYKTSKIHQTDYKKWIYKNSNSDLYNIRQYYWSSDCKKGVLKVIVPRRTIILLNLRLGFFCEDLFTLLI